MDVQIRYHNMTEKEDLSEHIERRLSQALDRFQRRIRRIMMHVYDLNGPRGGVDKRCLALVQLNAGGELAFELRDADAFSAVDRLFDKLKERLGRELGKRRSKRRASRVVETLS